jgi:hypothetical protein
MLFDTVLLAALSLCVACATLGFKLMNPTPHIWAPVAFTAASAFASLALARYLQTEPSLLVPPEKSLPLVVLVPLVTFLLFLLHGYGWLERAWRFAKSWKLRSPLVRRTEGIEGSMLGGSR